METSKNNIPDKVLRLQQVFEYYAINHATDGQKPNRASRRAAAFGVKCGKNAKRTKHNQRNGSMRRNRLTIG